MKNQMRRKFSQDESAVSPVVGVILMVAITVILAAIIAAFVLGLGSPKSAPKVSLKVVRADTAGNVCFTHQGGDTLRTSAAYTRVSIGGANATNALWYTAANGSTNALGDPGNLLPGESAVLRGSTTISANAVVILTDTTSNQQVAQATIPTVQTNSVTCP